MVFEFINEYFVRAIVEEGVAGYNIVNTPVYAIIFALAVFGTYRLLKRLEIKIDRNFFYGIFPFIVFGSLLRVVRDSSLHKTPLLVSPLIYITIFIVALAGLLASVLIGAKLGKKQDYWKFWAVIGAAAVAYTLVMVAPLGIANTEAALIVAGLTLGWGAVIYAAHRFRGRIKALSWLSKENALLLWTHMFDASTTFTALGFFAEQGYNEQHVLSNFVIGFLGPAGQFVIKLVVVPLVLWVLDRELHKDEDRQLRGFLKVAVFIIGFAPGLRNLLRLVIGV